MVKHLRFILFLALFLGGLSSFAQKIDTIYHVNGNVLTGEFKKMEYGVISWSMDGMGTISVEEIKVKTFKSPKQFELKLKNGMIFFGSIDTSSTNRYIKIILNNGFEEIRIDEIVEVFPIKRSFWLRTSGNFSLGANYTKGSKLGTVNFSGDLLYRKRKSSWALNWDEYTTIQHDTVSSAKADANFGWMRMLRNKWSLGTILGFGQNTELGTQARITLTFLGIRDLVYNNWNRFYLSGGVSLQHEKPYDDSPVSEDVAGILGASWKVYKYTKPKVWVDAYVIYVPYLTNWGRHRFISQLVPKVSIIGDDFKIGFKVYYTFDTTPPTENAEQHDWGANLELTYSFH